VRRALLLLLLAGAAYAAAGALGPLLGAGESPTYESREARIGDISTHMSFAATISAKRSQVATATARTSVSEVYVATGQSVRTGDRLLKLGNGTSYASEIDGTVDEVAVSAGDAVWPGMTLAQVCDFDGLQATLKVDEYDIRSLSVGRKCIATVVSLGLTFETEIAHVNRISSGGSVAYYTVTADIDAPESVLPGMLATVAIPAESAEGVVVIDMDALAFDEDGAHVLVKNGGAYERRSVEPGIDDGMLVEIVSGLEAGETAYFADGGEEAGGGFSFGELYRALFGETTVVRDRSGMTDRSQMIDPSQMIDQSGMPDPGEMGGWNGRGSG